MRGGAEGALSRLIGFFFPPCWAHHPSPNPLPRGERASALEVPVSSLALVSTFCPDRVGLVSAVQQGKQRMYRLEAEKLKPVHDWAKSFEKLWDHQLDRIKQRAERKARELN